MNRFHRPRTEANLLLNGEPPVASQHIINTAPTNRIWNLERNKSPINSSGVYQPNAAPIRDAHIPMPNSKRLARFWPSNMPIPYMRAPNNVDAPTRTPSRPLPQGTDIPPTQAPPLEYSHKEQTKPYAHRSATRIRDDRDGGLYSQEESSDRNPPNGKPRTDIQGRLKTSILKSNVISLARGKKVKQEFGNDPLPASRGRSDQRFPNDIKRAEVQRQDRAQEEGRADDMNYSKGRYPPQGGPSIKTKFSSWLFSQSRDSSQEGPKFSKLVPRRWSNLEQVRVTREAPTPKRSSRQRSRSTSRERGKLVKVPSPVEDRRNENVEGIRRTYSTGSRQENYDGRPAGSQPEGHRSRRTSNADRYGRSDRTYQADVRRDDARHIQSDGYVRDVRDTRDRRNRPPERSRSRERSRERDSGRDGRKYPRPEEVQISREPVIVARPPSNRPTSTASRSTRSVAQPLPVDDAAYRPRRGSVSSMQNRSVPISDSEARKLAPPPRNRAGSHVSVSDIPVVIQPRSRAGSRASATDVPIIAPTPRMPVEVPMHLPPPSRRRPSPSRSRSREIDPLTRNNTLHNARNLAYHPETDGEVRPHKSSLRRMSNFDRLPYHLGGTSVPVVNDRGYNSEITGRQALHPRRYTTSGMPQPIEPSSGYRIPMQPAPAPMSRHPSLTGVYPNVYNYQPESGRWYGR